MHEIQYIDYPVKKSEKAILKECAKLADYCGDYKGQISRINFHDIVMANRDEARKWIDRVDNGWYDNMAVKYKDGRKISWLVKIEYHC